MALGTVGMFSIRKLWVALRNMGKHMIHHHMG